MFMFLYKNKPISHDWSSELLSFDKLYFDILPSYRYIALLDNGELHRSSFISSPALTSKQYIWWKGTSGNPHIGNEPQTNFFYKNMFWCFFLC